VTADVMARAYLAQARMRVQALRLYAEARGWATVVREAQEAVALLLKGALRWVGGEPTRSHDPGPMLLVHAQAFPPWFAAHIADLVFISSTLAGDRGASFYGDERNRIPPDELFDETDAARAMERADFVLALCEKLMSPTP
jgi:HEPN domain-containing protein